MVIEYLPFAGALTIIGDEVKRAIKIRRDINTAFRIARDPTYEFMMKTLDSHEAPFIVSWLMKRHEKNRINRYFEAKESFGKTYIRSV